MALRSERIILAPHDHVAQFYDDDEHLFRTVGRELTEALLTGDAVVIVATPTHRALFERAFRKAKIDIAQKQASGLLAMHDAQETLERFLRDGRIDPEGFRRVIGDVLECAAAPGRPVHVFGEMVGILWDSGQIPLVIELEELWNELGTSFLFKLSCGYERSRVEEGADLEKIRDLHSAHDWLIADRKSIESSARSVGEISRSFPPDALAPSAARLFGLSALEQFDRRDLNDVVSLLVSELSTNAVLHAASEFTLAMSNSKGRVRVEVSDQSRLIPLRRDSAPSEISGRGMQLIEELADEWGVIIGPAGKVVWAEVR